jgi:hypothetical protein
LVVRGIGRPRASGVMLGLIDLSLQVLSLLSPGKHGASLQFPMAITAAFKSLYQKRFTDICKEQIANQVLIKGKHNHVKCVCCHDDIPLVIYLAN